MTGAQGFTLRSGEWEVTASGAVLDDDGWTDGHTTSTGGVAVPLGTSDAELAEALDRMQADERASAAARHELVISVRRNGQVLFSHASAGSASDGYTMLRWPPIVSDAGVLLRRTMEDARDEAGRVHWGTETLTPWFVRRDGTVEELSFELGVSPLCVLPDGRYLLPGADPLWRDSFTEPLSALALDGKLESLTAAGEPVSAPRLVRDVAPDWHVAREERQDEWDWFESYPWETDAARVDDATGQLRIRLVDDRTVDGALRWIVVDVPLGGGAASVLVDRGVTPGDDRAALPAP